jgi:hypothetical protein
MRRTKTIAKRFTLAGSNALQEACVRERVLSFVAVVERETVRLHFSNI